MKDESELNQLGNKNKHNAADEIDKNDPHKAEKLANIGKEDDVAEEAEKE